MSTLAPFAYGVGRDSQAYADDASVNNQVKTFSQFFEMYNEPNDSSFTHDGHEYALNGLLSATLGMVVRDIPVSRLTWIFDWDFPTDKKRIAATDLNAPIMVTMLGKGLVVLDGLDRLEKAVEGKRKTIKGIYVGQELLDRYRIS